MGYMVVSKKVITGSSDRQSFKLKQYRSMLSYLRESMSEEKILKLLVFIRIFFILVGVVSSLFGLIALILYFDPELPRPSYLAIAILLPLGIANIAGTLCSKTLKPSSLATLIVVSVLDFFIFSLGAYGWIMYQLRHPENYESAGSFVVPAIIALLSLASLIILLLPKTRHLFSNKM